MDPNQALRMSINVRVGNENGGYGGLNLSQEFTIPQCSFEDMAKIMKRFHDLMEEVKKYK